MIKDFFDGISSYAKAFRFLSRMRLWGYFLLPGLLSLATGIGILAAAWSLSDNVGRLLVSWYHWDWGKIVVENVASFLGGFLVLVVGLIVYKHLVTILASPFMSPLSEKVERELSGKPSTLKFSFRQIATDILRGVRIALRNSLRELFLTLLLLALSLLPILSPVTTVGIILLQAYYFGFGNMDFALERHFGVKESVLFVKRYRGLALGNGLVTMLLLMSVVGFLFVLPLATVAATIETVKRLEPISARKNNRPELVP